MSERRDRARARGVASAVVLMAAVVTPSSGQGVARGAGLESVDSLILLGRVAVARETLLSWSAETPRERRSEEEEQHALWLRAILTVDPSQASIGLLRLVVEHRVGPWTAPALLRLGRLAETRGDGERARAHYGALVRDHPQSAEAAAARLRLAELGG